MITKVNMKKINDEIKSKLTFSEYASYMFIFLSVLVSVYVYYRTNYTYQSIDAGYLKYYVISILSVIFWMIVLQLKEAARINIVLSTVVIIICLYIVEALLVYFKLDPVESISIKVDKAKELGIVYDSRTKLQAVEDMISDGIDAVPTVYPADMRLADKKPFLPLAGVSSKVTVYANENGEYLIYKSDRHGFHNPDDEWDSEEIDWLLVGDSFTHGAAVKPGQEISGQIRRLTNSSVINLGIGGNGPLLQLAGLKEYAELLKPKNTLWIYYEGNDLKGDIQRDKKNPILIKYLEDGFKQDLSIKQEEIDINLLEYIKKEKKKINIDLEFDDSGWVRLSIIRSLLNFNALESRQETVADIPLFSTILSLAKSRVEAWDGKLYFVYLPNFSRYNNNVDHDKYRKRNEVIGAVKRLGIPIIDIHKNVFSKHDDFRSLFPLRMNGHYNKEGYEKVAIEIINETI